MALDLILGIGITAFLIIYFAFQWDKEEHWLLQLICSFVFIFLIMLIPKAAIDNEDYCQVTLMNETITQGGNLTTNAYTYLCFTNTKATTNTFYKAIWWFIRFFILYIFLYFTYVVFIKENAWLK